METSKTELEAINSLPAEKRYKHFVKRVVDGELVWGLHSDGWAISANDSGEQSMPVWPAKDYAELCRTDYWENYEARSIPLSEFIVKMVPDLQNKNIRVAVATLPEGDAVVVEAERVRDDLEAELGKY